MEQVRLGKTDLVVSRVGFGGIPIQRLTKREAVRVVQACVDMVNPGGTGIPRFDISARFAPFPPRSDFILAEPSALPPPKKYTCFLPETCFAFCLFAGDFAATVISSSSF